MTTRARGRPKGSKTRDRHYLAVARPYCQGCGSTSLRYVRRIRSQAEQGVVPSTGQPYSVRRLDLWECKGCGDLTAVATYLNEITNI